jgi:hypothetical protein
VHTFSLKLNRQEEMLIKAVATEQDEKCGTFFCQVT